MKHVLHRIEFAGVWLFYTLCRLLPFRAASALGGALGWFIATLPASFNQTARTNLNKVFPELSAEEIRAIQQQSLVHFARSMAEFPRVYRLKPAEIEQMITATGIEHAQKNLPILMLSGHIGNWDILGMYMAMQNVPCAAVYRAANNPLVDRLMVRTRALSGVLQIPKGANGARQILKAIGQQQSVGMLMDQKMNDGIEVPFFGHPAMTAPALAELALKKNLAVVPAFCWRKKNGLFEVEIWPPVALHRSGDHQTDVRENTALFNSILERAIQKDRTQWMWFHRRFPKNSG